MSSPPDQAQPGTRRRHPVAMTVYGVVAAAVIGTASFLSIQSASGGSDLRANMTLIAPAGAGGGWDTFVREQQQAMRTNNIVNNAQVVNIPGAGGTIGLGQLTTMEGQANTIMSTGTVMLGGVALNDSPVSLADVRPIARMAEEYDALVVPADSPYNTLDELIADWKKDPKAFPFTGGSAGSIDHLIIADLALQAGIDPADITYIPKTSGGEAIQTISSGTAKAATSGFTEFADQVEAGRLKILGVASPEPLEGIDAPTFREQGYDVELTNWRGMVAPPGITDEEFAELEAIIAETVETPEWREALERNQWQDVYLTGPEFEQFIEEDRAEIEALIEELDL
ncbi:tricarboxylic transport membrane protein [Kocuria dechangensis]|uniref:Tricarboxylic transport membrane protein n=1 Tax=Kocuria dechangensis TaxID=1176249 RepID=A0A917LP54_9MICC|nr:tripartite tricarboxylate transporter substrate-binding protein [Kocuria dechangensis]GGG46947.1 tricarboxylic transport membrane protein [Kocuria dechangensis]